MDDFLAYWGFVAWIQVKSAARDDAPRLRPRADRAVDGGPRSNHSARDRRRRVRRDAPPAPLRAQLRPGDGALRPPALADARAARRRRSATSPTDHFETHFERLRAYAAFTPAANAAGAPAISLPLARQRVGTPDRRATSPRGATTTARCCELAQTLYPVDISPTR
jgi:amidase